MTDPARLVLESAEAMLEHLEPSEVVYYELSASYDDSVELPEGRIDVDLGFGTSFRLTEQGVDYRFRVDAPLPTGPVAVDVAIIYTADQPVAFHRDALKDFGERAAIMTLYPYARQAMADLVSKMRVPAIFLPVLRPGEISFEVSSLPEVVGAESSEERKGDADGS